MCPLILERGLGCGTPTIRGQSNTNPDALVSVKNPHFTYHPITGIVHLTGNSGAPVFEAIAPIGYALNLVGEVPWIRATSGPLDGLRSAGLPRNVNGDSEDLLTHAPAIMPTSSMRVEIDFIRPENVFDRRDNSSREFVWQTVGLRIRTGYIAPQIATLSWFHSC